MMQRAENRGLTGLFGATKIEFHKIFHNVQENLPPSRTEKAAQTGGLTV